MRSKVGLLFMLLLVPVFSFAQRGGYDDRNAYRGVRESSTLSIFSETGEQFFLVLNGINQNNSPQSKIRVEGLPKYDNDIQIVFADRHTPAIRRKINIADPVDGKAVNMVLKVTRNREGMPRLKFHKCTEVDHNYCAPRDEYVMNYGNPKQINTITETTYVDPVTGQTVTQTTTTTTTDDDRYDNRYDNRNNYQTPPPPPPPPAPVAMDQRTFNDVKQSINSGSFEETKLSTAKTILSSNYINTNQVMEICKLFSFEQTKVAFAKFAYSRTVDPNNYYKVGSVFDFDSNKQDLNNFISRGGR